MPEPPDDDADRRARVEADAAMYRRLAGQGFDPSCADWVTLMEVLIEYGYGVFKGWFQQGGEAYLAAKQLGVRGLSRIPRELRLPEDDAHDLAMTLLEVAIDKFRLVLAGAKWSPEGGASLSTFFVGRCLMELPDVHERWRRQQDRWANEVLDLDAIDRSARSYGDDPEEAALASVHYDELLPPGEHAHVRLMIDLSQSGYTMADIAKRFTDAGFLYSEATVRTRISRARSRARNRYNQSEKR